jgi:hypothetical protein
VLRPGERGCGPGRFNCLRQPSHRPGACREVVGPEEHDEAVAGFGEHDRKSAVIRGTHAGGLIIAVVGVEWNGKVRSLQSPVGALAYESMRDVAERAMRASQAGTDEVRELATDRSVGVVHADQPADRAFVGRHVSYGCWLLTETISPVMYEE